LIRYPIRGWLATEGDFFEQGIQLHDTEKKKLPTASKKKSEWLASRYLFALFDRPGRTADHPERPKWQALSRRYAPHLIEPFSQYTAAICRSCNGIDIQVFN
jgi:hypothetical protein